MINLSSIPYILIFLFGSLTSFSQTTKTIDSLETRCQVCLDKGEFMLGCSKSFYSQMDSLLNLEYKMLRSKCDKIQKGNLKDEQLEWLSKRDLQFKKNQQQVHKEAVEKEYSGGQDETMFLTEQNASFVKERVIALSNSTPETYSANQYQVDKTGFYSLDHKTEKRGGETYGYFGNIAIKSIAKDKIAIKLYVCKGAPSYNSGSIADTLLIKDNKAIYTVPSEIDSTCKVIFRFFRQGIEVEEITADYNCGCGFGHAVVATGYYKRKSYKIPTQKDLTFE